MRGAGRIGGRDFKPRPIKRAEDPLDLVENSVSPFLGDLPVPPTLTPINDDWSISDPFEPVDPRDCSKYPASPYCENDVIRFGPPIGFEYEIRTNGCTTCLYIYPVVGWMKLTPTVICRRDPNCREDNPPPNLRQTGKPPGLSETPRNSSYCAVREANINKKVNEANIENEREEIWLNYNREIAKRQGAEFIESKVILQYRFIGGRREAVDLTARRLMFITVDPTFEGDSFVVTKKTAYRPDRRRFGRWVDDVFDPSYESGRAQEGAFLGDTQYNLGYSYTTWSQGICPDGEIKPPPPAPPPFGRDDDRKRKKKPEERMCCNTCRDAKDNSDKLLKELNEIKRILGTGKLPSEIQKTVKLSDQSLTGLLNLLGKTAGVEKYPIEVPDSLLQGYGDGVSKLASSADFQFWFASQVDALVGQFPIDIEVKDIDPLKAGDQKKTITLPNLAEALAEMYGLTIKNSVNQEVELNMLLRLAAEMIATKNATIVAQDYARANANFLGYKANYKSRELIYNFDFAGANLDPKAKEPLVLEKLLSTVTGYVKGWELEDKETVVGFLQKLMFSAGIIKAVFFRGKNQQKELKREMESMSADEKAQEDKFAAFIKEINDPNSRFNRTAEGKPDIKDETPPDQKPKK